MGTDAGRRARIARLILLCFLKLFDQPVFQRNRLEFGTQIGCHPKRKPIWPRHETKRSYQRPGAQVVPARHSRDICDAKSTLRSLDKQIEMLRLKADDKPSASRDPCGVGLVECALR